MPHHGKCNSQLRLEDTNVNVEHSKLIDALGGPTKIVRLLEPHGRKLVPQAVSRWRKTGVPHYLRPTLLQIARAAGLDVPAGFLTTQAYQRGNRGG